MARNRMIKPEFWTSEQVLNCSRDARLLFVGLWNFADDHGVHPASFITLKAEVFPADGVSMDEVKKLVSELIEQRLLREYAVNGNSFWLVTGWHLHQKIEKPRSRYPLPESDLKLLPYGKDSTIIQRSVDDTSTTNRRLLDAEKKGKEKKRKEKDIHGVETPPVEVHENDLLAATKEIFKHWQSTMNHPKSKLDNKRQFIIQRALKLGYEVEDLKRAINGCAKTPYNMGKNNNNQRYDDIGLILRDSDHIERFINNASRVRDDENDLEQTSNLMTGVL